MNLCRPLDRFRSRFVEIKTAQEDGKWTTLLWHFFAVLSLLDSFPPRPLLGLDHPFLEASIMMRWHRRRRRHPLGERLAHRWREDSHIVVEEGMKVWRHSPAIKHPEIGRLGEREGGHSKQRDEGIANE
jgi:hypothetical protein